MAKFLIHATIVVLLTILTQLGGLAWIAARFFRAKILALFVSYAALTVGAIWVAPQFGRVALKCTDNGPLQVQSWLYCALNRTYVTEELAAVLNDTAKSIDRRFPGTQTLVLDTGFPFFDGFALLPHLSHDDGRKADLAFYYKDETGYLPGSTRSPIGYFAFEDGPTDCASRWPTLRWDLEMLQSFWKTYPIEPDRTRAVLLTLAEDPRVEKILVEPHLMRSLGISHSKARFQGCRAARHDDHIHFQVHSAAVR